MVSVIANVVMTQNDDHIRMRLISQLIRVTQKLLNYFMVLLFQHLFHLTSGWGGGLGVPVIFTLDLNDSNFRWFLHYCHIFADAFK